MIYLLFIQAGLKKVSMSLPTCQCCVEQSAATIFGRSSPLGNLAGDTLLHFGWCIASYFSLAQSGTDKVHHNARMIYGNLCSKVTNRHREREL